MGGLLTAEAVVLLSQSLSPPYSTLNSDTSHRVIGVVNFDVPFLGLYPHVVLSGIASLLPKSEKGKEEGKDSGNSSPGGVGVGVGVGTGEEKTEKQMNNLDQVRVVRRRDVDGNVGTGDLLSGEYF